MQLLAKLIRARARLAGERGFSLIELMVVLTILGLLSAVSVVTITVIMNSHLRSTQLMVQQTTIENTYGFLASRLATAERSQIGLPATGGDGLDPLSVAGDQLVFQSNTNVSGASISTCYRLMYLASREQIQVASSSEGCESIQPKRGPNQEVDGKFYVMPGEPLFDPALDLAYSEVREECASLQAQGTAPAGCSIRSWPIAEGIVNGALPEDLDRAELDDPVRTSIVEDGYLPPFAFLGLGQTPIAPTPDPIAGVSLQEGINPGDSSFYADMFDTQASIGSIQVRSVVSALEADSLSSEIAAPRYWQQDFSVAQQCFPTEESAGGGAGLAPVTLRYKLADLSVLPESWNKLPMETSTGVRTEDFGVSAGQQGKYQVSFSGLMTGGQSPLFMVTKNYLDPPQEIIDPEGDAVFSESGEAGTLSNRVVATGFPTFPFEAAGGDGSGVLSAVNLSGVVRLKEGDVLNIYVFGSFDVEVFKFATLRLDRISS